ncbi:branched-chain amino acid ABC transporter permease [Rhodopila sp.]|jgi:branched-chain amino acid transport system permease protein|uniref:branched-chain amino acid ABC transporter permease n=1 Tax=Rhodopila sp. TaxID=2480087 RepID=UPI002C5CAEE6|nr:branched-chain amino acid ABC transporter permease [Rhodopila sp.]HVZ10382.1 branched-chain amino acid ABC transporter permease [Rhodopila sp.]
MGRRSKQGLAIAGVLALAIVLPYVVSNDYLFHLIIMAVIWGILATSLNLVLGYTGLLSLAHGAFFGLGAYTSALLVTKCGWNFWATIPPSMLIAALGGILIGVLTLRLEGHYFAVSTMSFGIVVSLVLEKWDDLTEGPRGISSIPAPTPIPLFGLGHLTFESDIAKYYLALAMLLVCLLFVWRMIHSPVGRALEAIRQNELLASCLGVNLIYYKLLAFCFSAAMAGLAGVIYSTYITYLNPVDAGLWNGFYAVMYIVIGGMGTFLGPLVGTVFLVTVPEMLRVFQDYRLLLLGVLLILTITFLPEGIVGALKRFGRRRPSRARVSR